MNETNQLLWEEKSYTEQQKKSVFETIPNQNNITIGIENELQKLECKNIGHKSMWIRNCPKCNKEQSYSTKYSLDNAIFLGQLCYNCASKERGNNHHTKEDFVNQKFGKFTVTKQYVGSNNKTMVDCLCECGKIKTMPLWNIKLHRVKSCGCQRGESLRKPYGWAAFGQVYNGYRTNAVHGRRGIKEFSLSKKDALKLFSGNCFYCGRLPSKIKKDKIYYGEFVYNGIDRKDNSKGYTLDNCVSCCEFCNYTKNVTSFNDFISWVRIVYNNTKDIGIKNKELNLPVSVKFHCLNNLERFSEELSKC